MVWDPKHPEELVCDSGTITQSATYHTQPANYLDNDVRYRWQVPVWDNLNTPTTMAPEDFDVEIDDVPTLPSIAMSRSWAG